METFSRAGGQKVVWPNKSLPLHPHMLPTSDLAPREDGGGLALVLMGKVAARSGKTPALSQPNRAASLN